MIEEELVKRLTLLERRVDGLIKPEVPLGMSLIVETTLTGSAATVTLSSIPQGFRHLIVFCRCRTDRVAEVDNVEMRFNADGAGNYDLELISANAATLASAGTRAVVPTFFLSEAANSRADNFNGSYAIIFGYATGVEKTSWSISAGYGDISADTDIRLQIRSIRWRNVAAITSLVFAPTTGPNFVTGSRFQLYGVM